MDMSLSSICQQNTFSIKTIFVVLLTDSHCESHSLHLRCYFIRTGNMTEFCCWVCERGECKQSLVSVLHRQNATPTAVSGALYVIHMIAIHDSKKCRLGNNILFSNKRCFAFITNILSNKQTGLYPQNLDT